MRRIYKKFKNFYFIFEAGFLHFHLTLGRFHKEKGIRDIFLSFGFGYTLLVNKLAKGLFFHLAVLRMNVREAQSIGFYRELILEKCTQRRTP